MMDLISKNIREMSLLWITAMLKLKFESQVQYFNQCCLETWDINNSSWYPGGLATYIKSCYWHWVTNFYIFIENFVFWQLHNMWLSYWKLLPTELSKLAFVIWILELYAHVKIIYIGCLPPLLLEVCLVTWIQ